jgi:pimeloyl-ACP methyl ester carboxylesterase
MTTAARHLTEAGLRVVAVDLPGHAGGDTTDIKQVSAAIRDVIAAVGEPVAVIAHSFAAMALRMLFHDRAPATLVLLAPALKVSDVFSVFADRARLLPWTRKSLWRRLERWDPHAFPRLDHLGADDFPGAEVLMIHDPADDETPFARAAELAALRPGTDLLAMDGVGHVGVLSSPEALEAVTEFVGRRSRAARGAGVGAGPGVASVE